MKLYSAALSHIRRTQLGSPILLALLEFGDLPPETAEAARVEMAFRLK